MAPQDSQRPHNHHDDAFWMNLGYSQMNSAFPNLENSTSPEGHPSGHEQHMATDSPGFGVGLEDGGRMPMRQPASSAHPVVRRYGRDYGGRNAFAVQNDPDRMQGLERYGYPHTQTGRNQSVAPGGWPADNGSYAHQGNQLQQVGNDEQEEEENNNGNAYVYPPVPTLNSPLAQINCSNDPILHTTSAQVDYRSAQLPSSAQVNSRPSQFPSSPQVDFQAARSSPSSTAQIHTSADRFPSSVTGQVNSRPTQFPSSPQIHSPADRFPSSTARQVNSRPAQISSSHRRNLPAGRFPSSSSSAQILSPASRFPSSALDQATFQPDQVASPAPTGINLRSVPFIAPGTARSQLRPTQRLQRPSLPSNFSPAHSPSSSSTAAASRPARNNDQSAAMAPMTRSAKAAIRTGAAQTCLPALPGTHDVAVQTEPAAPGASRDVAVQTEPVAPAAAVNAAGDDADDDAVDDDDEDDENPPPRSGSTRYANGPGCPHPGCTSRNHHDVHVATHTLQCMVEGCPDGNPTFSNAAGIGMHLIERHNNGSETNCHWPGCDHTRVRKRNHLSLHLRTHNYRAGKD